MFINFGHTIILVNFDNFQQNAMTFVFLFPFLAPFFQHLVFFWFTWLTIQHHVLPDLVLFTQVDFRPTTFN